MTRDVRRGWPLGKATLAKSAPGSGADTATVTELRARRCPWLRAALRTADPAVLAAVQRVHPPAYCPAARRERAA